MPVFAYAGTARGGKSVTAEINADTRELAIEQLRSQGITVKSIEEKKKAKALFGERKQKITDKDIVVFTRQFATMINAGLPLVQCLEILATQCDNKTFGKLIGEVKMDVESGTTYADALKRHPKVFSSLYSNMVQAGGVGGALHVPTERLAEQLGKRAKPQAQVTRTFGTLLQSGVPIMEGLEIVARISGNKVVENAILDARQNVGEGKTLSDPLSKSAVFPPMVVQMINVGEATGALDAMLGKIADFYDDEVDAAVTALTSLLEPVLMVFLGTVIGFIVIAMYLPNFKMAAVVG